MQTERSLAKTERGNDCDPTWCLQRSICQFMFHKRQTDRLLLNLCQTFRLAGQALKATTRGLCPWQRARHVKALLLATSLPHARESKEPGLVEWDNSIPLTKLRIVSDRLSLKTDAKSIRPWPRFRMMIRSEWIKVLTADAVRCLDSWTQPLLNLFQIAIWLQL